MIPFNIPPCGTNSLLYVHKAVESRKICGDGPYTLLCHAWMEQRFCTQKFLLTTSGTHALEMAAQLCGFQQGDEVILPSYTFSSTANAFVMAGAKLVFIDIRPDTMNLDEKMIEPAITKRTKAICVVHYAGVACEMNTILAIAHRHNLMVVEDAAQGVMSTYQGKALGAIGDFGCFSFHETKNYSMGEGGGVLIKDGGHNEHAEILREKGTDRTKFYRGQVDKYRWMAYGSSYLPSELNAAYLFAQLEQADEINAERLSFWTAYHNALQPLAQRGKIALPTIPAGCVHNAHMYYIKAKDLAERTALIAYLAQNGIMAPFHYVPLHTSPAGKKFGRFHGEDRFTTAESSRLLRLPLYYGLKTTSVQEVVEKINTFYC